MKVTYYETNDYVSSYNKVKSLVTGDRLIDKRNRALHCGLSVSQALILNEGERIRLPLDAACTQRAATIAIPRGGQVLSIQAINCCEPATPDTTDAVP